MVVNVTLLKERLLYVCYTQGKYCNYLLIFSLHVNLRGFPINQGTCHLNFNVLSESLSA